MYPPKAGQEYQGFPTGYPPPQQMTTGYPPPPPNAYAPPPQNPYVQPPPPPPNPYAQVPYAPQPPHQGTPLRPTEWSSSLFACTEDQSNCCVTCFCPCITFGQIAEIVDEGSTSCAFGGAVYAVLCYFTGFACCYSCFYRKKMRVQFNLEETCTDCVVHWCCELCALCQEYRELKSRGYDPALGWIGNQQKQEREMGSAMTPPVNPNMAR
ncbi:hypothetical protein SUGI_1054990 [Cryptomeria japonica]|nr:hypothetical protein SUGI_1054990 [Cryptomeria japonica]